VDRQAPSSTKSSGSGGVVVDGGDMDDGIQFMTTSMRGAGEIRLKDVGNKPMIRLTSE
jgi:hypothetical protein